MKTTNISKEAIITTLVLLFVILIQHACRKDVNENNSSSDFILSSPAIGKDSLLPVDYTCKGTSASLPLHWQGVPPGTVSLALIMDHETSSTDIHCYWIIYNMSPDTFNFKTYFIIFVMQHKFPKLPAGFQLFII